MSERFERRMRIREVERQLVEMASDDPRREELLDERNALVEADHLEWQRSVRHFYLG